VVGSLVSALAQCIQAMIIECVLYCVGIVITSSIVPLYISKVPPIDIRESPCWLIKRRKLTKAEGTIKKLWGKFFFDEAMFELRSRTRDVIEDVGWFDLFSRRYRKGITLHILIIYHIKRSSILRRK
jgi:hypothetical protein